MSAPERLLPEGGLVIAAYAFPPMSAGPAFILDRLLGRFDLGETVIFAGEPHGYTGHADEFGESHARVVRMDVPARWPARDRRALGVPLRVRTAGNLLVASRLAVSLARALRRPEARALLAVYPKQHFLLAACLAARTTRKPFLVYFTDVYVEGLPRGRRTARRIERYLARRASVVFAMSGPHREQLVERIAAYGMEPNVVEIPHPYPAPAPDAEVRRLDGSPSILFTGAIYDAQADSVARVADAVRSLDGARLHLFSQMPPADVAAEGVRVGGPVTLRAATSEETLAAQRGADILFLPIAFSANKVVRRTAAPTKLPEYLSAGVPILVHAPPDAYVTRYAREHGFAEIVDSPEEAALARAVERLATDETRRAELVAAAARTFERHRAERVAEVFADAVRAAIARPRA